MYRGVEPRPTSSQATGSAAVTEFASHSRFFPAAQSIPPGIGETGADGETTASQVREMTRHPPQGVRASDAADVSGSTIVSAVRRLDGELIPQPPGDLVLRAGDTLIASGTADAMDRLDALFAPKESARSGR